METEANAKIIEPNGVYYSIRLSWLPRVGDAIELRTFVVAPEDSAEETAAQCKPYRITKVVHCVNDVKLPAETNRGGDHQIHLYVEKGEFSPPPIRLPTNHRD